jgi:hypothetical protein
MSATLVTPANTATVVSLDSARAAVVEIAGKTGEVLSTYATALNQSFDLLGADGKVTTKWFDLKGKLAAPIKAERTKFVEAFKAKGFEQGTIDVYWSRVKDAAGRIKTQNRVSGDSDPAALNLADLKTLINRIFKMEEDGKETDWSDEKAVLMDVFGRMGGDVEKLG